MAGAARGPCTVGGVKPSLVGIVIALAALLLLPAAASAGTVEVRVVEDLDLADLAQTAAVGVLVPGWGDTVSRASALEALASGRLDNPLRDRDRPPLIALGTPIQAPSVDGTVVVYVELPPDGTRGNDRRYPVAIVGGGWAGLLRSPSTRIPGLVSIADIAPTVLQTAGLEIPEGIAGHVLSTVPDAGAALTAERVDTRLSQTRDARLPATAAGAAIVLVLVALGALGSAVAARAALLAVPAGMAASVALALAGTSRWWLFAVVTAVLAVGGGMLARTRPALGMLVIGGIAATFVGLAWWGPEMSLSLLGPNPDGGGRSYGVPNELETMLAGSAVVAGALFWPLGGSAALMITGTIGLMTVTPDRLGASVTGAAVIAVAFGVLSLALEGRRGIIPLAVVGAAAASILLLAGPEHAAGAGGGRLLDRIELSARLSVSSLEAALLTFVAGVLPLVLLALAYPRARARLEPPESAALLALLVAAPVSLVLNDSPSGVLTSFAIWCLALLVFGLATAKGGRPDASYRLDPSWPGSRFFSPPSSPSAS